MVKGKEKSVDNLEMLHCCSIRADVLVHFILSISTGFFSSCFFPSKGSWLGLKATSTLTIKSAAELKLLPSTEGTHTERRWREDGGRWLFLRPRELFVGCIFSGIEPNMKGYDAFVVFHFIIRYFQSALFPVGDELFICWGQALICESSGTVSAGRADAGTDEDKQWLVT